MRATAFFSPRILALSEKSDLKSLLLSAGPNVAVLGAVAAVVIAAAAAAATNSSAAAVPAPADTPSAAPPTPATPNGDKDYLDMRG